MAQALKNIDSNTNQCNDSIKRIRHETVDENLSIEDQMFIVKSNIECMLYVVSKDDMPMVHYLLQMLKIEVDTLNSN